MQLDLPSTYLPSKNLTSYVNAHLWRFSVCRIRTYMSSSLKHYFSLFICIRRNRLCLLRFHDNLAWNPEFEIGNPWNLVVMCSLKRNWLLMMKYSFFIFRYDLGITGHHLIFSACKSLRLQINSDSEQDETEITVKYQVFYLLLIINIYTNVCFIKIRTRHKM